MNVNEIIDITSHFKLVMASRRAAFSGNTSSVATFYSFYCFNTRTMVVAIILSSTTHMLMHLLATTGIYEQI